MWLGRGQGGREFAFRESQIIKLHFHEYRIESHRIRTKL